MFNLMIITLQFHCMMFEYLHVITFDTIIFYSIKKLQVVRRYDQMKWLVNSIGDYINVFVKL